MEGDNHSVSVAVLVSGGIDSAVLLAELCARHAKVHPLYVRNGLAWESAELVHLARFLSALANPALQPLRVLDLPVRDVYESHWSLSGLAVPDAGSPDEAVYLPGRNIFLFSKAAVWCVLRDIKVLAVGSLSANPFADSTPEFDELIRKLVDRALGKPLQIARPFRTLTKSDVLQRGVNLPLEHTFSCISPVDGTHCGRCNKCAERRRGFERAGLPDGTRYANATIES